MNNRKVLLVEDDKDNVRAMAVRLRAYGYQLVVAHDAISAISTARKEKPDIIVLDLGLPGGDGFVVMQRLKSNVDLMLVPIIVVSARDPLTNESRALEAGAEAFLQKPVDNDEFLTVLERALAKTGDAGRMVR
ncbi:MAG TPA: response regulator [Candidatus Sulfotelmatobacter sp.]|nr:response regulator [Candidatus Sulfotelmatobacter sp.]